MDLFYDLQHFFVVSLPDLPPDAWWVGAAVLGLLGVAAMIDLFKGIIPDALIFFGIVGLIPAQGEYRTWPHAAHQLTWGILAAVIIWGINELWYRTFKQDALGLGDAKWSLLAVACFGGLPVLFAWGVGAILGTVWIGAQKLIRRPAAHVHFAPFLFVGLIAGLWLLRVERWSLAFSF